MATQLVYIGDYAEAEAETLRSFGASLCRLSVANPVVPGEFDKLKSAMLRGKKLAADDYRMLCENLLSLGVKSRTMPDAYAVLSDSDLYERSIPDFVPKSHTFDLSSCQLLSDVVEIATWGQVFIRSEMGSVAKHAGLENCFVDSADPTDWSVKIQVLRNTFPNAARLICRAVVAVKKIGEVPSEGRFIVVQGHAPYLDHYEASGPEARTSFALAFGNAAAEVAERFERDGIVGDYFIDIGEKEAGGWFVVEVKPLYNGTIRDIRTFAEIIN